MTSHDPQRRCKAVRSAILATAWLLVLDFALLTVALYSNGNRIVAFHVERVNLMSNCQCFVIVANLTILRELFGIRASRCGRKKPHVL